MSDWQVQADAVPEVIATMSEADYLDFEAHQEARHEYCQGRVYAAMLSSFNASLVAVNVATQLHNQVSEDCVVVLTNLRLSIAHKESFRYPDVMVLCGEPVFAKNRTDTITNPIVLVEVLSPSTAAVDHQDKLEEYTAIDSVQAYLLFSQDEPKAKVYLCRTSDEWLYRIVTGMDAEIALPPLNCTLALANIYHKVRWTGAATGADVGDASGEA